MTDNDVIEKVAHEFSALWDRIHSLAGHVASSPAVQQEIQTAHEQVRQLLEEGETDATADVHGVATAVAGATDPAADGSEQVRPAPGAVPPASTANPATPATA